MPDGSVLMTRREACPPSGDKAHSKMRAGAIRWKHLNIRGVVRVLNTVRLLKRYSIDITEVPFCNLMAAIAFNNLATIAAKMIGKSVGP